MAEAGLDGVVMGDDLYFAGPGENLDSHGRVERRVLEQGADGESQPMGPALVAALAAAEESGLAISGSRPALDRLIAARR